MSNLLKLIGLLLPILIDLINSRVVNPQARFWISAVICAVAGVLVNWAETGFVFADSMGAADSISESVLSMFGLAQLSYKAVWAGSEVRSLMGLDGAKNAEK